jgi:cobalt/nickel transport system permease protein
MMVFLILTVFTGGYLSLRASGDPDGLEWAIERVAGVPELESAGNAHQRSAGLQDSLAFLPDYDYPEETGASRINGTTFSGLVGSLIVFLTAGISGFIISRVKRARQEQ